MRSSTSLVLIFALLVLLQLALAQQKAKKPAANKKPAAKKKCYNPDKLAEAFTVLPTKNADSISKMLTDKLIDKTKMKTVKGILAKCKTEKAGDDAAMATCALTRMEKPCPEVKILKTMIATLQAAAAAAASAGG